LSALLSYPDAGLLAALPELRAALDAPRRGQLAPLLSLLDGADDLIALQEQYVATFDRRPAHSLHLFEHIHGESRDRGQAMVDLREEYLRHGLVPDTAELPDYVPLFLELLGLIDPAQARQLLDEAIHVLAAIGARLARAGSPYSTVFAVLRGMTDVVPREQTDPPVRDMDEAMEAYGVGPDGVEPLLPMAAAGTHVVHFHPRARG
ncbi:nitrate reductase molybdenum cofactor assembly chaperone, partial [Pseudomonas stutzeri]|nr:nitrate reductase molybdenum cofactor assembly chaperone [Stutzerimonas stutzeri]